RSSLMNLSLIAVAPIVAVAGRPATLVLRIVYVAAWTGRQVLLGTHFVAGIHADIPADFVGAETLFDVAAQQRIQVELRLEPVAFVATQHPQGDLVLEADGLR